MSFKAKILSKLFLTLFTLKKAPMILNGKNSLHTMLKWRQSKSLKDPRAISKTCGFANQDKIQIEAMELLYAIHSMILKSGSMEDKKTEMVSWGPLFCKSTSKTPCFIKNVNLISGTMRWSVVLMAFLNFTGTKKDTSVHLLQSSVSGVTEILWYT